MSVSNRKPTKYILNLLWFDSAVLSSFLHFVIYSRTCFFQIRSWRGTEFANDVQPAVQRAVEPDVQPAVQSDGQPDGQAAVKPVVERASR